MIEVRIDITDWEDERKALDPDLSDKEAAINTQITRQLSPQVMGRAIVAGRETGNADASLEPPNKLLLQTGAALAWSETLRRESDRGKAANGSDVTYRALLGPIDGSDGAWIRAKEGSERARQYLLNAVPGHIKSRFNIMAVNGDDLSVVAEELIALIREMVAELTQ